MRRRHKRIGFDVADDGPDKNAMVYAHGPVSLWSDLWKGGGSDRGDQVNFALLQPLPGDSSLRLAFDWSAIAQFDYQDMSLEMVNRLGYQWDNFFPNFNAANPFAPGSGSAGSTPPKDENGENKGG
mgnify:CR=1 FL=1